MENNLQLGQQYDLPEDRSEFIDTSSNEVVKQEELNPFDVIKKLAEKTGADINDPKKDCKHCYGRGYIGRDSKTKAPIPCRCIFPKLQGKALEERQSAEEKFHKMSRKERRMLQAHAKRMSKKIKRKEYRDKKKGVSVSGTTDI